MIESMGVVLSRVRLALRHKDAETEGYRDFFLLGAVVMVTWMPKSNHLISSALTLFPPQPALCTRCWELRVQKSS